MCVTVARVWLCGVCHTEGERAHPSTSPRSPEKAPAVLPVTRRQLTKTRSEEATSEHQRGLLGVVACRGDGRYVRSQFARSCFLPLISTPSVLDFVHRDRSSVASVNMYYVAE